MVCCVHSLELVLKGSDILLAARPWKVFSAQESQMQSSFPCLVEQPPSIPLLPPLDGASWEVSWLTITLPYLAVNCI